MYYLIIQRSFFSKKHFIEANAAFRVAKISKNCWKTLITDLNHDLITWSWLKNAGNRITLIRCIIHNKCRCNAQIAQYVLEKFDPIRIGITLPNSIESKVYGAFNQNANDGSVDDENLNGVRPNHSFDSSLHHIFPLVTIKRIERGAKGLTMDV